MRVLLIPTLLGWLLAGCAQPAPPAAPPPASAYHAFPYHAQAISRSVVTVYSGSAAGLIVGGTGPLARNPGIDLWGLTFDVHDPATHTYLWPFAAGAKLLDRQCHPVDQSAMIGVANSIGQVAAIFIVYLGPDRLQIAPAKVVVWNRNGGDADRCIGEEPTG